MAPTSRNLAPLSDWLVSSAIELGIRSINYIFNFFLLSIYFNTLNIININYIFLLFNFFIIRLIWISININNKLKTQYY